MLYSEAARRNPASIRTKNGQVLSVPNCIEPVGFALWLDGVYEPDVMAFLEQSITPHSVVLDIGANIGAFTVPLAARIPGGTVIAIEASPSVARMLTSNIKTNGLSNVVVIECAASTGLSAALDFYEAPADHFGMGSLAPQFGASPTNVLAQSVDDILKSLSIANVDVMKVDVEGYEAHVFEGAKQLLTGRRAPLIVFEFCDWAEARAFSGETGRAQQVLLDYGYTLWILEDYLAKHKPMGAILRHGFWSIVAVPAENRGNEVIG